MERENTIGLGTDDPHVMRSCRKKVRLSYNVIVYAVRLLLHVAAEFSVVAYDVLMCRLKKITLKESEFYAVGIRWTTFVL